jgi:hypothetical protein
MWRLGKLLRGAPLTLTEVDALAVGGSEMLEGARKIGPAGFRDAAQLKWNGAGHAERHSRRLFAAHPAFSIAGPPCIQAARPAR